MGIKVVDPLASGEYVGTASSTYTATVYSDKPIVTISPKSINFGDNPIEEDTAGPYPVTITNVSEVTIEVTFEVSNAYGSYFSVTSPASPLTLTPGQSADLSVLLNLGDCMSDHIPCTVHYSGSITIWSASVTPGTPGTTYLQGKVSLIGEGYFDGD
jgi:hypothetical protein